MLDEFIDYLKEMLGNPYIWGGQHTKLTVDNFESVIAKKEKDADDRDNLIAFCRAKFDNGVGILYGFDCSGLGMYWLQNLKKIYKSDMSANSMMRTCELKTDAPEKGWWIFRCNSKGEAVHIAYMISDTEYIEAKGRKYGVVAGVFKAKDWDKWGIPPVFADEINGVAESVDDEDEGEEPTEEEKVGKKYVKVVGGSVYVRVAGNKDSKAITVVHRGSTYAWTGDDPVTGWHGILISGNQGYISNKKKYTELIE